MKNASSGTRDPARRPHLRARRQPQDDRARELRDVRVAARRAAGGRHLGDPYSAIYYYAIDTNGNKIADPNEILFGLGNIGYYGFDPQNPTRLDTINQIGKYATPRTQEVMVGMDHELMPNFGISGTFTYRYFNHFDWNTAIGVTSANYRQTGTLTGNAIRSAFSTPFYAIDPDAVPPGGGTSYEEREGITSASSGSKSARSSACRTTGWPAWGSPPTSHDEYLTVPTRWTIRRTLANPRIDGGTVVTRPAAAARATSTWCCRIPVHRQRHVSGTVGHELRGNWLLRQGYAEPYSAATSPRATRSRTTRACWRWETSTISGCRRDSLDARVEKAFKIQRAIMLDLDIFNIFNVATVLGRQYDTRPLGRPVTTRCWKS